MTQEIRNLHHWINYKGERRDPIFDHKGRKKRYWTWMFGQEVQMSMYSYAPYHVKINYLMAKKTVLQMLNRVLR